MLMLMPDVQWVSADKRSAAFPEGPPAVPPGTRGLNVRIGRIDVLDIKRGVFDLFRGAADVYPLFLLAAPSAVDPLVIQPVRVFHDIRPGEALPLPEVASPTIFRTMELPPWIDVHVLLMKSRKKERDLAKGILEALASSEGKAIKAAILTAASAANPTAAVVTPLAIGLLNLVCRFIANGEDEQLFYSHASIEQADSYCINKPITLTDSRFASVVLNVQAVL